MKRLFLSLAVLISISTIGFTAPTKGKYSYNLKKIDLSTDQENKITEIKNELKLKLNNLKTDSTISQESRSDCKKKLVQQYKKDINSILSDEQKTKLKELRAEKRSNRHNIKSHKAHTGKSFDKINLSKDQKAQIKAINENFRTQSKVLHKERTSAINNILTSEQLIKRDELRKGQKHSNIKKRNNRHAHKHFSQNGKFDFDSDTKAKLETLKQEYLKEKKAIELSRIAPNEQNRRLEELQKKYRESNKLIKKEAKNNMKNHNLPI